MSQAAPNVGSARDRVDGPAKVTGAAKYAGEYDAPGLLYGVVVSSPIAKGRITGVDVSAAKAIAGVVEIFTHENRPRTAWFDYRYRDETAPPGSPFRPLYSDEVQYSGQPIALAVAETLEAAGYAAALVRFTFEEAPHQTDLDVAKAEAYVPPKKRNNVKPPPKPKGHAAEAFAQSPIKIRGEYRVAIEHHNPMEPHASTVVYENGGKLTIFEKTQGPQNSQSYVAGVFGLASKDVRVLSPYVGGAFGSGLRPQYQLFLAVMAALALKRSVRVTLTRDQMFTNGYRPHTIQTVSLGANSDGVLQSLVHEAVASTSPWEDYQEVVVNWSNRLYHCDNTDYDYKLAKIDTYTPLDMRAPGAALGVYATETAMDELAYASGVDPVELRLRNYAEIAEDENKYFTSRELRSCYQMAAQRFGWERRNPSPRSMREGRELIGWGMATGIWEALQQKTSARAVLTSDGKLEVSTASADIGTGTYTILAQVGADALGLPMSDVTVRLGDSSLPMSPVEGGSWTAASAGSAVQAACEAVKRQVLYIARSDKNSPLANAAFEHVTFADRRVRLISDPSRFVTLADAMRIAGLDRIEAQETASPSMITNLSYVGYTHSAIFAEVRVDEDLAQIRVPRIVIAVAAGRIMNPKTARSQVLGGVVMGLGMALEEESLLDHRLGRFMNHNLSEYHVPVNADVYDIDVIFALERDDKLNPIGVKGLGEIGIVGTAAAVANAVYHATGTRIRDLPITLDKLLVAR